MNRIPTRIVKVGGSLLDWPNLGTALQQWLSSQPDAINLLVAGGGRLADEIRELDRRFCLAPQVSHNLCLEVLRITAKLLAALLPDGELLTDLDQIRSYLRTTTNNSTVIFCPHHFMTQWEPQNHSSPLPASWDVTSDSIAARVAEVLQADELVLCKSADPPFSDQRAVGYVDNYFPMATNWSVRIRYVNLRGNA